jgi:phenylalanyl-tRNA synthetase alpha chain
MEFTNKNIKEAYEQLNKDISSLNSEELKKKYLGKKGEITELLKKIKDLNPEDKKEYGKEVNILKRFAEEKLEQLSSSTHTQRNTTKLDPTAPYDINTKKENRPQTINKGGSVHPLMQEMQNMLDIFSSMGFDILESRQLDDDYHMFETLNIPKGHPARDIWDTFWTDENLIPPAHTSTMQNRAMKKFGPAPIRAVIPGRCYRNEATDASHEHTFYQIEGVYVDKNISMSDMLGTIKTYLENFFDKELDIKVQPAYFPFTEPDVEFMISCPFCNKTGCTVCQYSGWMEVMGCGMIHPSVLTEAGIDPEEYSGFAWGFGLDRLVMIKNGIKDIRRLHSGDLNFLRQF